MFPLGSMLSRLNCHRPPCAAYTFSVCCGSVWRKGIWRWPCGILPRTQLLLLVNPHAEAKGVVAPTPARGLSLCEISARRPKSSSLNSCVLTAFVGRSDRQREEVTGSTVLSCMTKPHFTWQLSPDMSTFLMLILLNFNSCCYSICVCYVNTHMLSCPLSVVMMLKFCLNFCLICSWPDCLNSSKLG